MAETSQASPQRRHVTPRGSTQLAPICATRASGAGIASPGRKALNRFRLVSVISISAPR